MRGGSTSWRALPVLSTILSALGLLPRSDRDHLGRPFRFFRGNPPFCPLYRGGLNSDSVLFKIHFSAQAVISLNILSHSTLTISDLVRASARHNQVEELIGLCRIEASQFPDGIQIDQQDPALPGGNASGQVDGGRYLPDPPLCY